MRFFYNLMAVILVLAALPVFAYRCLREAGFSERLRQSFGWLPAHALDTVAGKDCIWLHAASVGEIVATSPLVKELKEAMPDTPVLVSVVTASGYAMAQRILKDADGLIFFPLDLPWLPGKVIRTVRPKAFLLVETELWPNFLYAARQCAIPVMMVNGRISDRSVKRYHYLRGVLRDMLETVERYCMQSAIDAQYIIQLGADPHRVVVTGNTKFDQTYTQVTEAEREELKDALGLPAQGPVIVAGSTHAGEEESLLQAFRAAREVYPAASLVLAPRDLLRADELTRLCQAQGLPVRRRTQPAAHSAGGVVLLDTIGELGRVYSVAEVVFVGGSLVPHGGHNILEPAAHGKAILIGPHMFNFKETYALFSGRQACQTVYDGQELTAAVLRLLADDRERQRMEAVTLEIVLENRGASKRSIQYLQELLAAKGHAGSGKRSQL